MLNLPIVVGFLGHDYRYPNSSRCCVGIAPIHWLKTPTTNGDQTSATLLFFKAILLKTRDTGRLVTVTAIPNTQAAINGHSVRNPTLNRVEVF